MIPAETPVSFRNRRGQKLFGILHTPPSARHDIAILLLSPGIKMRVGPGCLYRQMTDALVRLGFPVLRFDFYGIGDSEGRHSETLLADVYNHMEVGRFVEDTLDAMDWMQDRYGYTRFLLSGLCGGAVTGLLAGSRNPRVAGLLSLGITPVLASSAAAPALYMTAGQLDKLRSRYLRKLLDPASWWRIVTLKTDFRLLWKSLVSPFRQRGRHRPSVPAPADPGNADPVRDNANPLFPPAFFGVATSGRPHLLIFSGADRLYWEFQEKFVARYGERLKSVESRYNVHVIANANHVLSLPEWRMEMMKIVEEWLGRNFAR